MRTRTQTRIADTTDARIHVDVLSAHDGYRAHVTVKRPIPRMMRDDNVIAVRFVIADCRNATGKSRIHRRAVRCRHIDTGMKGAQAGKRTLPPTVI